MQHDNTRQPATASIWVSGPREQSHCSQVPVSFAILHMGLARLLLLLQHGGWSRTQWNLMYYKYSWDTLAKAIKTNKHSRDKRLYICMLWLWSQGQSAHEPSEAGFHSQLHIADEQLSIPASFFPQPHLWLKLLICSLLDKLYIVWLRGQGHTLS